MALSFGPFLKFSLKIFWSEALFIGLPKKTKGLPSLEDWEVLVIRSGLKIVINLDLFFNFIGSSVTFFYQKNSVIVQYESEESEKVSNV